MWKAGDTVALRGVYRTWACYVQSARVIKDTAQETVLLVEPGAECAWPAGYIYRRHGDGSPWDRWHDTMHNTLDVQIHEWHTNRFLILLEPQRYFATFYIWEQASGEFQYYYINFQLPFVRSTFGFDTLDLDLDILVDLENKWEWKDVDDYQHGIRSGGITAEWVDGIEKAKDEVFARIEKSMYPLDRSWLEWRPDASWPKTRLPANWDVV
jgi:protein associated with RNAse G/E